LLASIVRGMVHAERLQFFTCWFPMLASALAPAAVIAAAVAPALLVLWLIVAADSRPEPARMVFVALLLGVASAIAAVILELVLAAIWPLPHHPWLNALFHAAIPEEIVKVPLIAAIALRSRHFDEPMDGVVYGAAVGLGFAAIENIGYVLGAGAGWGSVAILRSVLSVPLHGAFGAIAGAYIARARFAGVLRSGRGVLWHRRRLFAMAWLVPTVLHALFDGAVFSLKNLADAKPPTSDEAVSGLALMLLILIIGFGTLVYAAVLARRIARRQKQWLSTKRLPPAHWRAVWAECLIGLGLCFVAVALVIAGESVGRLIGCVLLVAAVGIARRCARYLNEAATSRHRASPAAASP
jgi:RsiW-degrading membrane proteinase PrsW (M82 family)